MAKLICLIMLFAAGVFGTDVPVKKHADCIFPFTYKGVKYTDCSNTNSKYYWCSVKKVYDGNWHYCTVEAKKDDSKDDFAKLFEKVKEQERRIIAAEKNAKKEGCTCLKEIDDMTKMVSGLSVIINDHQRRLVGGESQLSTLMKTEHEFNSFMPSLKQILTYVTKC